MAHRLDGKVALVFGAGSSGPGWGNGKAVAVLFAREGATGVAVDVELAAAAETHGIIRGEGGACEAAVADVTRADQVEAVVARTLAQFGRIDILHNNVGRTEMAELTDISEESWHRIMDINLT